MPPKPGLVRVSEDGGAIEVEVWELAPDDYGRFVAEVPAPLAIGTLELEDGDVVKGFVCEPRALAGSVDITRLGGWRAYLDQT
jgi:allophanate hydrolase